MAKPNQQMQDNAPSRGQNAKRFGKYGLIAGAVAGLATGGIFGIVKSALLFGGIGLVGGAVAGNKLNPLIDKLTSFLPGRRKDAAAEEQGVAPVQDIVQAPSVEASRGIDSLDPSVLAGLRDQVGEAVAKGRAGSAEAVNSAAVEAATGQGVPGGWVEAVSKKQPTHPAHMTPQ